MEGREGMMGGMGREGWTSITSLRQMGWKLFGATDSRAADRRRRKGEKRRKLNLLSLHSSISTTHDSPLSSSHLTRGSPNFEAFPSSSLPPPLLCARCVCFAPELGAPRCHYKQRRLSGTAGRRYQTDCGVAGIPPIFVLHLPPPAPPRPRRFKDISVRVCA